MNLIHRMLIAVMLGCAVALGGCESDPGKVSKGELGNVRESYGELTIGMPKDEALAMFEKGGVHRLSSSSVDGVSVEEYKVEAYYDDDWKKTRDLFVTFLYFTDGTLAEISDKRVDYRTNSEIVGRWTGAAGAPAGEPEEGAADADEGDAGDE